MIGIRRRYVKEERGGGTGEERRKDGEVEVAARAQL